MKAAAQPVQPSRKEFLALAKEHTLVPVCRILTADLETPVSAFLRAAWPERECFMLESVENGEQVGRYTFIGLAPFKRIVARGREITITEGKRVVQIEGDIFAVLRRALSGHKPARLPGLPPFTAGAVGFFSYDAVRQIERLPELAKDELGVPDACLLFFDEVLAFDHVRKEIWLVVTADVTRGKPPRRTTEPSSGSTGWRSGSRSRCPSCRAKNQSRGKLKVRHRTAKKDFLAAVERTKEYIAAGDMFSGGHFAAVRCGAGGRQLPGLSRAAHGESEPIYVLPALCAGGRAGGRAEWRRSLQKEKGSRNRSSWRGLRRSCWCACTRARWSTGRLPGRGRAARPKRKTRRLADEMLHDEKERAEHVMLVDLGRNDVGRVSEFGSVKVDRLMFVERYSHVMHIVSSIEGRLKPDLTAVDALRACFPAGTLSRRAQGAGHGDHRGAGAGAARHLWRRGALRGLLRQSRLLHRDPVDAGHRRQRLCAGRRGHRGRLGA